MIPATATGRRIHALTLTIPGEGVPDGLGGLTPGPPTTIGPLLGDIAPASARNAERILPTVVIASASHLVTIPYLAGVTLTSSLVFHDPIAGDRTFAITGIADLDERHVTLVLACEESR